MLFSYGYVNSMKRMKHEWSHDTIPTELHQDSYNFLNWVLDFANCFVFSKLNTREWRYFFSIRQFLMYEL